MGVGDVVVDLNVGNFKRGAFFDDVDDKVVTTMNPSVDLTGSFTIVAWVMINESKDGNWIFGADDSGGDRFYLKGQVSDEMTVGLSSWNGTTNSNIFPANVWTHVAMVLDGTTGFVYVNGVEAITQAGITVSMPNRDFVMGIKPVGLNAFYGGIISDVKIYNRSLSTTELIADKAGLIQTGLIHRWKLDFDYTDSVGSHDGTNSGSRLTAVDDQIAQAIKAARASGGATDNFMLANASDKILSAVVEET